MTATRSGVAAALLLVTAGCAAEGSIARRRPLYPPARERRAGAPPASAGPAPGASAAAAPREVERAVAAASSLVGRRTIVVGGVDYGPGCAALVRAAFDQAGRPLPPDSRDAAELHALAARRGWLATSRRPAAGDLVFLADAPGGPPAHVGLVARADPDGTAVVLHRVARGVQRIRVNLSWPNRPVDPATGKHVNDELVVGGRSAPAGSLVVGVATLLRAR